MQQRDVQSQPFVLLGSVPGATEKHFVQEMESDTGTFWSDFHVSTDHNKSRKRKPTHPCISDSRADFKHGQTGWTSHCSLHFSSRWKRSGGVFKSYLLSFVRPGHCASESWERTKSHSSIPADSGRERQWRMKLFIPPFPVLVLEDFSFSLKEPW